MHSIFLLTVYCDDGREENYPFAQYKDALDTIATTWSRVPNPPRLEMGEPFGVIRVTDRDSLKLLAYCRPMRILTGPTHV